jgi:outer membrane lipoprotein-sorting protein
MRKWFLTSIILSLFFLGACAPRYVKPTIYREATSEELIDLIQKKEARIKTIRASLRMGFKDLEKKSSQHCLGVLAFEKPDRFRIKGYPQMGPTLFEIVSDGKSLWVYIPKEGKVYLSQDLKKRTSKADFNFQDLRSAFSVAEILNQPDVNKFLEKRGKEYILYLTKKRLVGKVWIERSNFLVTKIERFDRDGSLALEVSFDQYQKIDDIDFPKEMRISNPKEKKILTLLIQKVRLNEAVKPEVFQFKAPKEIEIIYLNKEE